MFDCILCWGGGGIWSETRTGTLQRRYLNKEVLVQYVLPRSVCSAPSPLFSQLRASLTVFCHIFFVVVVYIGFFFSFFFTQWSTFHLLGCFGEHLGRALCIAQPSPARVRSFFFITSTHLGYFSASHVRYFHITACSVIYRLILLLLSENPVMGHKIDGKQQSACHKGRLFHLLRSLTAVDSTQPSCRVDATWATSGLRRPSGSTNVI